MCNKKIIALLISAILIFSTFTFNASALELNAISMTIAEYEACKSNPPAKFSFRSIKAPAMDNTELRNYLFDAIYNYRVDYNAIVTVEDENGIKSEVEYECIDVEKFNLFGNDGYTTITDLILGGMPETFRNITVVTVLFDENGYIPCISLEYALEINEFQSMYNEFLPVVNEMTKGLNSKRISDIKKALILHDRLAIKCEYDLLAAKELEEFKEANGENAIAPWEAAATAYGALVDGSAICQGYTEAYEYLLEQVGIKSERCSSNLLNHIWNILYIDGETYHVDVTWDDPVFKDENGNEINKPAEYKNYIKHDNFLLSSNALYNNGHNKDGYWDYNDTPHSTTYDDYFWKEYHTESFMIGNDVYYFDDDKNLCGYDKHEPLVDSGIADIDHNKKIDSLDVSSCRQYLTGKHTPDVTEETKSYDVNYNGSIDITDLVRFKKILTYLG